jgi:hypothetical protein
MREVFRGERKEARGGGDILDMIELIATQYIHPS